MRKVMTLVVVTDTDTETESVIESINALDGVTTVDLLENREVEDEKDEEE